MPMYVKGIKPKPISPSKLRLELLNALRKEGRLQVKLLKQTVVHWKGAKPTFKYLISIAGGDITLIIGPGGSTKGAQKWVWIDEGTDPYIIRPRKKSYLRFRSGGRSGSRRGTLATSRSTRGKGQWITTKIIHHPGIKSRNWSITLYKQRFKPYRENMNLAVKRGIVP